jgi:7,8-dihydroneopterin aldolase/epimerase/oxygenase
MKASGPSELGIVMRPGGTYRRPSSPPAQADTGVDPTQAETKAIATKIFIRGLNVVAECGVYAHEKGRTRPLIVDIEVWVRGDVRGAGDALSATVDYDTLARHVHDVAGAAHLHLIETFAEHVCAKILADDRIERVRLRVEKPGSVEGAVCSGVELERTR